MTRLKKTASLAAALAATLLLSTALANAAPAHRNPAHSASHYADRGVAPAKFQAGKNKSDARGRHEFVQRDRRDGKAESRVAKRGRRVSYPDYDHARYGDRFRRPPLRFEARVAAPHAGLVWRAGHWHWLNGRWAWIGGTWRIAAAARR